ncbi:MAG: glycosyltransferase family 1 protein [Desulfonatronovibrio sp.]
MKSLRTIIFFPPVKNITGGMQVLLQIAGQLRELDHEACFYLWEKGHAGFLENLGFDVFTGNKIKLESDDVFLVPEGWPNVLSQGINSGARCMIYCQNWAYLFSGLPEGVSWQDLPVEFLAVSDPVRVFIEKSLGKSSLIIRPFIDKEIFYPPARKPCRPVNIAYMPRKNRGLYKQIRQVFESRNRSMNEINWVCIEGLSLDKVADKLRKSHVFLATGFPEGLGLPCIEAMACGCLVTGFAGFGGWDYMRQVNIGGYMPRFPLCPVPWKGNGYFSADGDVLDAALNLERAVKLCLRPDETLSGILENSLLTAGYYSKKNQKKEILAWQGNSFR